ncbi:hypothetical protein BDU57DRAFT_524721 [Ampelomyces quisqualis]|uniref:Uncharacterized protein n=1 Tax=Ampelomyces quisqualis TaxID=50730 RepID=A0A6A5Q7Z9_AMPQU|nr:hypothetical protein BDU57DRAFT_524721 [Ampelomyces quisqualis]
MPGCFPLTSLYQAIASHCQNIPSNLLLLVHSSQPSSQHSIQSPSTTMYARTILALFCTVLSVLAAPLPDSKSAIGNVAAISNDQHVSPYLDLDRRNPEAKRFGAGTHDAVSAWKFGGGKRDAEPSGRFGGGRREAGPVRFGGSRTGTN